jgi:Fe-Mn family superoxide dismutase
MAVRNNAGGHYNHGLFWKWMTPKGGGSPSAALAKAISDAFGDLAAFKDAVAKAAMGRFGSGWAWLVVDGGGALKIVSTPNQDTPLADKQKPVLGLDVWEHAYYLKYQNRRADYITAWWNVVNWAEVDTLFGQAKG